MKKFFDKHKHPGRNKYKKLIITGGVVLLIVVAGGAGVLVSWLQRSNTPQSDNADNAGTLAERLPPKIKESQDLALNGKVEESNKVLTDALAQPNVSNEEKNNLIMQQGVNALNQDNFVKALEYFKQAEAIEPSYATSRTIADSAYNAGDKQTALEYYKKALAQLFPEHTVYESEKAGIEETIKELSK